MRRKAVTAREVSWRRFSASNTSIGIRRSGSPANRIGGPHGVAQLTLVGNVESRQAGEALIGRDPLLHVRKM
jgi:hypothetical protein